MLGEIGNVGVHRRQAGGRGIRIADVAGQDRTAVGVQDAQVTPVACVEFLAMDDLDAGCGKIAAHAGVGDVRKALLLVDDERVDDRQILAEGLFGEMTRCVAVGPGVIHVHVRIPGHPARAAVGREMPGMQRDLQRDPLPRSRHDRAGDDRRLEAVRYRYRQRFGRGVQHRLARRVEVVTFHVRIVTVITVVGMNPGR